MCVACSDCDFMCNGIVIYIMYIYIWMYARSIHFESKYVFFKEGVKLQTRSDIVTCYMLKKLKTAIKSDIVVTKNEKNMLK